MKNHTFFKISAILVMSILIFSFSFSDKQHDPKLVGMWKGFEKDKQIEGVEKHWILQRFKNGTYVIMFTSKQDCDIQTFTEKGQWWTKDQKYFEKSENNEKIDSYSYTVENLEVVSYKSIELLGEKNTTYEFTDYRLDLD